MQQDGLGAELLDYGQELGELYLVAMPVIEICKHPFTAAMALDCRTDNN